MAQILALWLLGNPCISLGLSFGTCPAMAAGRLGALGGAGPAVHLGCGGSG